MVFWFLSVKEVSSAFCCFSQHSSPWKDLSGRKSSTRSPLCPWIFELAVFLLALGTPCSLSLQGQIMDTVVLLMRCRAWTSLQVSKIFSSITSADEPKMLLCAFYLLSFSFHFFFSFPVLWRWQHCRYSRPIFSCLFAHCCAHMLLYVHSPALAPERVSGFRKKSWVVAVVVKDAQMQYFCIYSEISWEHLGVSCSTQLKLSCITQLCRFGLTLVSFVREKPLTQLFSWPHAYIIFPRYI